VRRNGLGSLRVKSESNAQAFYDFYYNDVDDFDLKYQIVMIVCIIVLVASLLLLMMVVNSVHKTSTQVLSLFMYIPLSEIKELEGHCQNFKVKYLLDRKIQSDYSFSDETGLGMGSKKTSQLNKNGHHLYQPLTGEPMITEEISEDMRASGQMTESASMGTAHTPGISDLAISALRAKYQLMKRGESDSVTGRFDTMTGRYDTVTGRFDTVTGRFDTTARFLKTEGDVLPESPVKRREEEEEREKKEAHKVIELNEDLILSRSEKFRQSRDEYRLRVFLQFMLIGLVFVGYFVGDYVDNRNKMNKLRISLNHLRLLVDRSANARFIQTFTLEILGEGNEAAVNNYAYLPAMDLRQHYITEVLNNMKDLSTSRRDKFASAFDSYFSVYDAYTNGDLCDSYYASDPISCGEISNGLMKQGLTIAVTGIEQKSESVILAYTTSSKAEQDQKDAINSDDFKNAEELLENTLPVMRDLRDKFLDSFGDFIDNTMTLSKVKYGIFLAILLLVFFIVWIPYKTTLMEKIFKTKGMLKMIPIDLITKDENMKAVFFGGNILKGVK